MATDNEHNSLPGELERALRRATSRTLGMLTSLRRTVRAHVHQQRAGGNDLDEIQLQLRTIATLAMDDVPPVAQMDGEQSTLTRQIIKWSSGFYSEGRTTK